MWIPTKPLGLLYFVTFKTTKKYYEYKDEKTEIT